MLNIQEKKEESLGLLDAIIQLLEDFKKLNKKGSSSALSAGVTETDAFAYLFDILKSLNGNTQEVLDLFVKILEKVMPVMEASVKAILLANIKSEIGCGSDPIIPNKYREFYYNSQYALYQDNKYSTKFDENYVEAKTMLVSGLEFGDGIKVNVGAIDFMDKLKYNPVAEGGDLLYFGVKQGQSPYSLCRADDMDAFIWFTMNKAKFYSAYQTSGLQDLKGHFNAETLVKVVDGAPYKPIADEFKKKDMDNTNTLFSLYDFFYVSNFTSTLKNCACGTVIKYPNSNTISLCTKIITCEGQTETAQFFPMSDSYNGAMWYVDSFCYSGKDLIWYSQSSDEKAEHDALYGDTTTEDNLDKYTEDSTINDNSYIHPRDFEKEFPIFRLEYDGMTSGKRYIPTSSKIDTTSYGGSTSRNNSNLTFKILPKPFIHYPCVANGFTQVFLYKKILFDSYGNSTKKGKFSCYIDPSYTSTYKRQVQITGDIKEYDVTGASITTNYTLHQSGKVDDDGNAVMDKDGNQKLVYDYLEYRVLDGKSFKSIGTTADINGTDNSIGTLRVYKNGSYELVMKDGHLKQECLYPCYENSTIYQFNYQYVMGLQLFNAKQILINALNFTMGLTANLSIGITEKQGVDQRRIIEIIKNMCMVDSSSVSDCFYSFSNEKYEAMLNKADTLRHGGYQFNGADNLVHKVSTEDIEDILNEYDSCTTLNERISVLKRAVTEASVSITTTEDKADRVDLSTGITYEFLKELIQNLVVSMVSALLTPKVVLLFSINQQIMGNYGEYSSIENFLKSIQSIIVELVKEIRDMILEELLAFVLEKIKEIISLWMSLVTEEYYQKIKEILRLLKDDMLGCLPSWGKQRVLDTELPIVDYADIDNTTVPVTEHCD